MKRKIILLCFLWMPWISVSAQADSLEIILNETLSSLDDHQLNKFISRYKNDPRIRSYLSDCPIEIPLDRTKVNSDYGLRFHPTEGIYKPHKGIDFQADYGTPVFASGNGEIVKSRYDSENGNYITIRHNYGFESIYCHLSVLLVSRGDKVSAGEEIARVGNTGKATGPHLHYAIKRHNRFIDPLLLILN